MIMIQLSIVKVVLFYVSLCVAPTFGFVIPSPDRTVASSTSSTRLFLDKRIARLIDSEDYRQHHKKEFESEWMEKNRGAVLQSLNFEATVISDLEEQHENFRQMTKDKKLAKEDPRRYCADRCVSTGNCDVYEDIFNFSPLEVLEFCNDCVLSDADEPCDIPESFYDKLMP